ncbi:DISP complex protein LRCH3 isoform X8 [Chiloscyllium plagiosum]|uniref:DISP complex protein LRCH3 isoform X8 n=1 Tax=Chiloscyllium plagiosum TaxID=36176 RepID=UPI001CB81BA2|nr:DISP complex protein LRCH3 isoform X8 [Chiloscyllium plagiosum]
MAAAATTTMLMSECQLGIAGGGVGLNGFSGAGGGGSVHNGSGSAQPPWNRSLERALEEAAATGVLSLSGRKLKEFPRSAANQDLTDTTQADLSKNRLVEIPADVCYFVSLESLNLYQNCIRSIPEAILNLQSLTSLNISRNQLTTLPGHVCSLPLKVLIASNNKLISVPEEIGLLRQLTELDVSCNEIQTLPSQIGNLEILRDLNLRRNHLVTLPEELADLPLVRLDISCNKVTTIPVCYRNLRHLQTIILDNNPLQSPPAQICIKGKIHIFKYLNIEACKSVPELPEYDRTRPVGFSSCHEDYFSGRPYGALDSGFNSVDSGDKRWSGNEPADELTDLPQRMTEVVKEQRQRRDSQYHEHRGVPPVTNGPVEHDLEQIDYIDSCAMEEEEEDMRLPKRLDSSSLSSQFIAYIERRRINYDAVPMKSKHVGDPQKPVSDRGWPQQNSVFSEAGLSSPTPSCGQSVVSNVGCSESELQRRREQLLVEQTRREAQLAAQQYEEERIRTKQIQKEAVLDFVRTEERPPVSPYASITQSSVNIDVNSSTSSFPPNQDSEDTLILQNQKQCDEQRVLQQLRKNIETRLKISLPSDLGSALTDGVVLCHLANHVRPRSVPSIHVPSPAVPKLTMAKCRRNVENFLDACKRIGVPQDDLCSSSDVLQANLLSTQKTVDMLLTLGASITSPVLTPFSGSIVPAPSHSRRERTGTGSRDNRKSA